MKELNIRGARINIGLTKEVIAIIISVISFVISTISIYVNNLKSPDISFITAPYIKHVVDNGSLNEAFYIPLTMVNRGARPGTVLSFELKVTYQADGKSQIYYGQYFTQENSQTNLGNFFTPITLYGYSSESFTVCFYPLGIMEGNFFSQTGVYEFEIVGMVTNVKNESSKPISNHFRITVDEAMLDVMQAQPDGEYLYPLPIESLP
jgi:hypothetical protein